MWDEAGDDWEWDSWHPGMSDEAPTSQWGEWEFDGKDSTLDGEPMDSDIDGEPFDSSILGGKPLDSNSHGQTCTLT